MSRDYIEKTQKRALAEFVESIGAEKGRVYISSPDEAPEDVNVQEGEQGGYYYESDGATPEAETPGETGDALDGISEVVVDNEMEDTIPNEVAQDMADHVEERAGEEPERDEALDAISEWVVDRQLEDAIPQDVAEDMADAIAE